MIDSARNIALIGFMGAGKTSVGRVLAHLTKMSFVDADTQIEEIVKMPISHIFELCGEGHFRCLEYEFYRDNMPTMKNTVIATGGGAILDKRIRTILRENALTIYLEASPQAIISRIENDSSRPLLANCNKIAKIDALLTERDMLYRRTCHAIIDTSGANINVCAEKILSIVLSLTKKPYVR